MMNFTDNENIKGFCQRKLCVPAQGIINRQKAEIEAFKHYYNECLKDLKNANAEIERFEQIEATINEFWSELQKLSIAKGKETPTLEELLEYIEQVKAEAIKEVIERLKSKKTTAISCDLFEEVVRLSDVESIINETESDTE